jgi:hypothetical protein
MQLESITAREREGKTELSNILKQIKLNQLETNAFYKILLQRHWLSHAFTPIYDIALNSLTTKADFAKPIIRKIIREEYPGGVRTPSHREDLITDLIQIGIKHSEIKKTVATEETLEVIKEAFELVLSFSNNENFSDIMLLAFLRYWGEVLTALEYESFWPRIKKLLNGKDSVFYFFHITHDKETDELDTIAKTHIKGFTHSDYLGRRLVKMMNINQSKYKGIHNNEAIDSAIQAITLSTQNKIKFYKQFI